MRSHAGGALPAPRGLVPPLPAARPLPHPLCGRSRTLRSSRGGLERAAAWRAAHAGRAQRLGQGRAPARMDIAQSASGCLRPDMQRGVARPHPGLNGPHSYIARYHGRPGRRITNVILRWPAAPEQAAALGAGSHGPAAGRRPDLPGASRQAQSLGRRRRRHQRRAPRRPDLPGASRQAQSPRRRHQATAALQNRYPTRKPPYAERRLGATPTGH